jgi:hypothetical protein
LIGYGEFQRFYNRSGVKDSAGVYSFPDFLKMLAELGAVGRMVAISDEHVTAQFEYAEPSRLIITPGDVLCFHPVFSGQYRMIRPESVPESYRPVYPLGTDLDTEDRRQDQTTL